VEVYNQKSRHWIRVGNLKLIARIIAKSKTLGGKT
jgi:hypothetical protein